MGTGILYRPCFHGQPVGAPCGSCALLHCHGAFFFPGINISFVDYLERYFFPVNRLFWTVINFFSPFPENTGHHATHCPQVSLSEGP